MRGQVACINLVVRSDSSLDGPTKMQTKRQVRPRHRPEALHHLILAEVDVELVGSPNLRDNLDRCNQTLVSHFSSLLLQEFIAFGIVLS